MSIKVTLQRVLIFICIALFEYQMNMFLAVQDVWNLAHFHSVGQEVASVMNTLARELLFL